MLQLRSMPAAKTSVGSSLRIRTAWTHDKRDCGRRHVRCVKMMFVGWELFVDFGVDVA